ncbi:hypothetical protein GCM10017774_48800 [Lentzea cavernae]|uniref:Uncharacterized protein n=1 Tax=Lentzea cavernae TaxID=2020703 RepID=A0ABQ3MI88_9PSEU|nr:hypothetical protein GCM10017774_48800 [Lentzea cavernae]
MHAAWRGDAKRAVRTCCRLGSGAPRSCDWGLTLRGGVLPLIGHGRALFSPAFPAVSAPRQRLKVKPQSQPRSSSRPEGPPSQRDRTQRNATNPRQTERKTKNDPPETPDGSSTNLKKPKE